MPHVNFSNPPIREVSFGLRLPNFGGLRSAHYGAFWQRIRDDFPVTEDKGQVVTAEEPPQQVEGWFPLPRVWFVHRDQSHLIQIQPNRFWLNWRRFSDAEAYPRFDALFPEFQHRWTQFDAFLRDESLGSADPIRCELSYVNQIPIERRIGSFDDLGKVFSMFAAPLPRAVLPAVRAIAWSTTYEIGPTSLRAELKSGQELAGERRSTFMLELRAISGPVNDTAAATHWFADANEIITKGFCDLTTDWAQTELWGRT